MRNAILSLLLVAASPVFAAFRFEPPQPTNRTAVILQVREIWPSGCVPFNPRVTRSGNTVDVAWQISDLPCPAVLRPWNDDVPLGVFEAGVYDVIVRVDRVYATLKLVVTEEAPALRIEPRVLSSDAATEVRISGPGFCANETQLVVTVDGVAVPARVEQCSVIATFPAHAPGPATVRVRFAGGDFSTIAAVRYIDPDDAPDESLFERILIPVIYNGPGAFGSQWVTEVEMINRSESALTWVPRVSQPLPALARGASTPLTMFGNRLSGLLLFVPRGQDVAFGSMIRDVSRDATQWGTEMPVVREHDVNEELLNEAIILPNVPFDPRYRLQLRVYGIDGVPFSVIVSASREGFRRSAPLAVGGPCPQSPCNSNQPAFGTLDLMQTFPTLTGRQQITVTTTGSSRERPRVWAFVSVTNNVTQQVTTISPQ